MVAMDDAANNQRNQIETDETTGLAAHDLIRNISLSPRPLWQEALRFNELST